MSETGDLGLRSFREQNVRRCNAAFRPLDEWSAERYGCALAGEVGEALNLLKKRWRDEDISDKAIANELSDAFCYLDLLAARLGIDLAGAVVSKFNEVSKRKNYAPVLEFSSGPPAPAPDDEASRHSKEHPCPACDGSGKLTLVAPTSDWGSSPPPPDAAPLVDIAQRLRKLGSDCIALEKDRPDIALRSVGVTALSHAGYVEDEVAKATDPATQA